MALDKHGVPQRKMDQYLFRGDHPTDQIPAVTNEAWVTPQLQEAAKTFDLSWDHSLSEHLAEHRVRSVLLKFKDSGTRQRFFKALQAFATHYRTHLSTGVEMPVEAGQDAVMLRWEFFRPDISTELLQNLAKTNLNSVPVPEQDCELAELYLKAFEIPFVRMDLHTEEGVDLAITERLEPPLAESQRRLMAFLRLFLPSLPSDGVHRVVVHDVNRIEVDGVEREFKGAAKRGLLALVLLRDTPTFKTKDFVCYYNGEKNPADPRHDFNNAMGPLKEILPRLKTESDQGNRTVTNLQIRVEVSDDAVKQHLKMLH